MAIQTAIKVCARALHIGLNHDAREQRINRAVYPVSMSVDLVVRFDGRVRRMPYALRSWRIDASSPDAVRAVREYLARALQQLDGLIVQSDGALPGKAEHKANE